MIFHDLTWFSENEGEGLKAVWIFSENSSAFGIVTRPLFSWLDQQKEKYFFTPGAFWSPWARQAQEQQTRRGSAAQAFDGPEIRNVF